jgi:hypothetical protein
MPFPLALLLALALVVANDCAGHFHLLAPAAILLTPLVLLDITALLHTDRPPRQLVPAAVSTALLLCLHDAGLTKYGSGDHDAEGRGFLNLFLLLGLLAAHELQGRLVRQTNGASPRQRRGALWVGPLLVGSYLLLFKR